MYYGGNIAWNRTWGGIQQIIYLLGSFGIPLFFLVNGYLLSQKDIDFKFANGRLCKYFKFMLLWAIICGIPFSIIEHRVMFFYLIKGKRLNLG